MKEEKGEEEEEKEMTRDAKHRGKQGRGLRRNQTCSHLEAELQVSMPA